MSKRRKKNTPRTITHHWQNENNDNPLIARAEVAELLYKTLQRVAPKDIDGVQRAYVDANRDSFEINTTTKDNDSIGMLYGLKPVSVAVMNDPFPLIPTQAGPPQFDARKQFHRSMLRQVLRSIVDEV